MILPICLMLGLTMQQPTLQNITEFENRVGCKVNQISYYTDYLTVDTNRLKAFISRGIIPTIYYQPQMTFPQINSGRYDNDVVKFAQDLKATNNKVNVSLFPEWAEWMKYAKSSVNTIEQYRAAFNRFAGIIKKTAPKVQIHWTVNVRFIGDYGKYETYYPGDALVDYVTLTGFDFYKTNKWSQPRHFYEVFKESYDEITLLTNKDVIVSETSTAGMGEYKTIWWNNAFADICLNFPKIKRITLFNILEVRKTWTANWKIDPLNLKGIFTKGNPCY